MGKHYKKNKKKNIFQKIWKYRRLIILILIVILIILFLVFVIRNRETTETTETNIQTENNLSSIDIETEEETEIIESSIEELILGQTIVESANGYTTVFSTETKDYIEYKQMIGSWAENDYWGGTMSENGCGITSLAIIASGYGLDVTPEDLREKYYPHLDADDIADAINDLGIECTDFWFSSIYLNEEYISEWLETDRPILICLDNTNSNMWTELSHYMVLLDIDEDGNFYVSNPNGEDGSETASNWYSPDEVLPYIAKALFIESY